MNEGSSKDSLGLLTFIISNRSFSPGGAWSLIALVFPSLFWSRTKMKIPGASGKPWGRNSPDDEDEGDDAITVHFPTCTLYFLLISRQCLFCGFCFSFISLSYPLHIFQFLFLQYPTCFLCIPLYSETAERCSVTQLFPFRRGGGEAGVDRAAVDVVREGSAPKMVFPENIRVKTFLVCFSSFQQSKISGPSETAIWRFWYAKLAIVHSSRACFVD